MGSKTAKQLHLCLLVLKSWFAKLILRRRARAGLGQAEKQRTSAGVRVVSRPAEEGPRMRPLPRVRSRLQEERGASRLPDPSVPRDLCQSRPKVAYRPDPASLWHFLNHFWSLTCQLLKFKSAICTLRFHSLTSLYFKYIYHHGTGNCYTI